MVFKVAYCVPCDRFPCVEEITIWFWLHLSPLVLHRGWLFCRVRWIHMSTRLSASDEKPMRVREDSLEECVVLERGRWCVCVRSFPIGSIEVLLRENSKRGGVEDWHNFMSLWKMTWQKVVFFVQGWVWMGGGLKEGWEEI